MKTPAIKPIRGEPERQLISNDIVISVKNLTKTYRIFGHPGDRIKQALTFGRMRFHLEFTALQDISFEIKKGETVGIIGRNGSGKSTLLQLICGILKPTSGEVQVKGRISALLELGAGFNPEFTGRENVYFQGAVMGIPKEEMNTKFDEIATFADIGEFIDQPVRTYSSGMFVRLAFAVAVYVEPDILVVDEALAVGDIAFQRKCFQKMEEFVSNNGALIVVTHDLESVRRLCDRAFLINQGKLEHAGKSKEICDAYEKALFSTGVANPTHNNTLDYSTGEPIHKPVSYPSTDVYIENSWLATPKGEEITILHTQSDFSWNYRVHFNKPIDNPIFGMMVKTREGICVYGVDTSNRPELARSFQQGEKIVVSFKLKNYLLPGVYYLNCGVRSSQEARFLHRIVDSSILRVAPSADAGASGMVNLDAQIQIWQEPASAWGPTST